MSDFLQIVFHSSFFSHQFCMSSLQKRSKKIKMFVIALLTNLGRFFYLWSLPAREAINYAMARKSPIIFGSYVVHLFFVVSSVEEWIKSCKMTKAGNLLYCNIQPIVFVHVVNLWLNQFLSCLQMISFLLKKI